MDGYFAQVLSESTLLPLHICDYILDFSSDSIAIVSNRDNAPVGWFFYTLTFKPIKEIITDLEIDYCKTCGEWKQDCSDDCS